MEKRIGNYLIEIEQDMYPESPRMWDNLGTIVCFHNRYTLGDKNDYDSDDYNGWDEMEKVIVKNEDTSVILPIFMYEHSGITINTTGFSCPWDSGKIGFTFVSKEKVRKEYGVKRISKKLLERITGILVNEVKTYDQYLTGDVYGFKISKISECNLGHEHTEELDSCCGFYGQDYCLKEAESMVEYYKQPKQLELELVS